MASNTPQSVINTIIADYDGVDATDADNVSRRARLLGFLQHGYEYIWNYREWSWTYKEAELTVAAGANSVALPEDFLEFGTQGGLFDMASSRPITETSRYILERLRRLGSSLLTFAIYGGLIQFPTAASAPSSLRIFYRFKAATLVDAAEPTTTTITYPTTGNILVDPGFESWTSPELLAYWTVELSGLDAYVTRLTGASIDQGIYAALLTVDVAAGYARVKQTATTTIDTLYQLRFRGKTAAGLADLYVYIYNPTTGNYYDGTVWAAAVAPAYVDSAHSAAYATVTLDFITEHTGTTLEIWVQNTDATPSTSYYLDNFTLSPGVAGPSTYTFEIPDKYVDTVILPLLAFRAQSSKQDARDMWSGIFRDGLSQMCAMENPQKTGVHRMPLAVRGAW